jgi:hypothetical protein
MLIASTLNATMLYATSQHTGRKHTSQGSTAVIVPCFAEEYALHFFYNQHRPTQMD